MPSPPLPAPPAPHDPLPPPPASKARNTSEGDTDPITSSRERSPEMTGSGAVRGVAAASIPSIDSNSPARRFDSCSRTECHKRLHFGTESHHSGDKAGSRLRIPALDLNPCIHLCMYLYRLSDHVIIPLLPASQEPCASRVYLRPGYQCSASQEGQRTAPP